jgi:hypothetical protein
MKEKLRAYDALLDTIHAFFLRPQMWCAQTPEAVEAFFSALVMSVDIVCDNDRRLSKKLDTVHRPPINKVTVNELIEIYKRFYKDSFYLKFEPLPTENIPVRQELEVLSADEPKQLKLGWTITEYIGPEVYKWDERDGKPWPFRLSEEESLKAGDKLCFGWEAEGWSYEVVEDEYGVLSGISRGGNTSAVLRFDEDERHCWVAMGFINLRSIRKLELKTKDE